MSLTLGGGPLTSRRPPQVNYAIDGPAHLLFFDSFPRRVRATFAGQSVRAGDRVATNAIWSYPDPLPAAQWFQGHRAIDWNAMDAWFDEDEQLYGHLSLQPSGTTAVCPYKGGSTYWSTPGLPDAAWSYDQPLTDAATIAGHVCLSHDELAIDTLEEIGG